MGKVTIKKVLHSKYDKETYTKHTWFDFGASDCAR